MSTENNPSFIRNVSVIENEANTNSPSLIPDDVNVVDASAYTAPVGESAVNVTNEHNSDDEKDDDESDYSYTYEEDEYSGFLIQPPVRVEEDAVAPAVDNSASASAAAAATAEDDVPAPVEKERKQKWVEPTPAAVTMSLRAESEKTGGRRRLASDLYKIMSSPTAEQGFTLSPSQEDSMEKWTIKLFDFDADSNLAKDLLVVGVDCVELEMSFHEQYPFEPPFVRVVTPKFQKQTGFVMNGALCMELLTKQGWTPINDIESVIVSIRSLMVVGDGRVQAAVNMDEKAYAESLKLGIERKKGEENDNDGGKRKRSGSDDNAERGETKGGRKANVGTYTAAEASSAYDHLSKFHEEKGWDKSGWWAKRG